MAECRIGTQTSSWPREAHWPPSWKIGLHKKCIKVPSVPPYPDMDINCSHHIRKSFLRIPAPVETTPVPQSLRGGPALMTTMDAAPPPAASAPRPISLHSLGLRSGTDKAHVHQYLFFYEPLLLHLRSRSFDMLEIGVNREASLKMWDSFFPSANVFGADVKSYQSSRILKLDQSEQRDIERVASMKQWHLVVDDGSHKPSHQLATFLAFFPRMPAGSTYIIEDVEASYWQPCSRNGLGMYHWNLNDDGVDIVGMFRDAVDTALNHHLICTQSQLRQPVFGSAIDETIGSVTFIRNSIIIYKTPSEYKVNRALKWRNQLACNHSSPAGYQAQARPRLMQPRRTNLDCAAMRSG